MQRRNLKRGSVTASVRKGVIGMQSAASDSVAGMYLDVQNFPKFPPHTSNLVHAQWRLSIVRNHSGAPITHHRMPSNIVVCRPVAWRLKIGAGSIVRKSQVYIRLCQTIGIIWAIDIAIVLPNLAICHSLGHSLGHFHGLVSLLGALACKATKSSVFPLVLFMLLKSSSLGGL
jgi:hypothetical protein